MWIPLHLLSDDAAKPIGLMIMPPGRGFCSAGVRPSTSSPSIWLFRIICISSMLTRVTCTASKRLEPQYGVVHYHCGSPRVHAGMQTCTR